MVLADRNSQKCRNYQITFANLNKFSHPAISPDSRNTNFSDFVSFAICNANFPFNCIPIHHNSFQQIPELWDLTDRVRLFDEGDYPHRYHTTGEQQCFDIIDFLDQARPVAATLFIG
jgi:hypothetical protein